MSCAYIPGTFVEQWLPLKSGLDLYYRDFGGGAKSAATPVICLPGYWRTCRDFEELAVHLSSTRRVLTPDMRGRGRSGRASDPGDYHFDHLANDVIALLDALGIARAVFVGMALGAQLSMDIAVRKPSYVAGVVLNDSGPESNPLAGKRMAAFSGGDELTYEQALDRVRAQYAPDFPRLGEADWVRLVRRGYSETAAGRFVRDYDQLTNQELGRMKAERPDFWKEFLAIRNIPIAILRGENSDFLTEDIATRMVAANPAATLYTIPGCGHPPTLYEPEAIFAVEALLAMVEAGA